jgi:hypothetical protein
MTSFAFGVNKVTEALDDASTTLSQFLYVSKERYLSDIVMGNEAGGAYISPCSVRLFTLN